MWFKKKRLVCTLMGKFLARAIMLYTYAVKEPSLPSEQQPNIKRIICSGVYSWVRLTYQDCSGFVH
jgi:hypothetical protein